MARPEDIILADIQAEYGRATRLWRNSVMTAYVGGPRTWRGRTITIQNAITIRAGLIESSGDLIGIGPGGLFLSIEVKVPGKNATPAQRKWRDMVLDRGGLAGTAHDVEEAGQIIRGERRV